MMCDHNFASPCYNSFYHQYMQQHAALSYQFQKLHNIHNEAPFFNMHSPVNVYNHSSYSSSCSSCSSESSSETSSGSDENEDMDNVEQDDYDEDESECEYELNVEAILAMRAAKEELKKQELAESSASKDEESSESKDESSDSQDEKESKSDSIVVVESESDKDDFEFIDLSGSNILQMKPFRNVGRFHKTAEAENRKIFMEHVYGSQSNIITALETTMNINFQAFCDELQPPLWPVLPLRL